MGDGVWIRKSDASFEFYASLLHYKVLTVWSGHFLGSTKELPIQREGLGSGLRCCHDDDDDDEIASGMAMRVMCAVVADPCGSRLLSHSS